MEKQKIISVELARWYDENDKENSVNINTYLNYVESENKQAIANFILNRFHSRYLKPFLYVGNSEFKRLYKNGFSIMANCCLLIETLESFKKGWKNTIGRSERAFEDFFKSEPQFAMFKGFEKSFYKNVRCGILHQGESTGGWRIRRAGKVFDTETFEINSVLFAEVLLMTLKSYSTKLEQSDWNSEIWVNFRKKMNTIIENCRPE